MTKAVLKPTPGVNITLDELLQMQDSHRLTVKAPPVRALSSGQHISRMRGRGMDFSEIRNYQPGDDIRQMDWRVTARTGQPHIKLYHEERERPVFIVVDFNASMFFGTKSSFKSVLAARFATLLGFGASQLGDKVGGIVFSGDELKEFRPKARKQGVLPLVKTLSDFSFQLNQNKIRPLSQVLLQLRRVTKPGSLIFLISDFNHVDADAEGLILKTQKHCDLIAYHVVDTLEKNPPKPGAYSISDGKQEIRINTTEEAFRKRYRLYYKNKVKQLTPLFKPGCLIELTQEQDLTLLVQQAFSLTQQGVRR
jgi:uncharacterized protein (DUF58 family)